jgi:hypothetical protein
MNVHLMSCDDVDDDDGGIAGVLETDMLILNRRMFGNGV